MRTRTYNHRSGLSVISKEMTSEIRAVIEAYKKPLSTYKISDFKAYLIPELKRHGWSDKYRIDQSSGITITSIKRKTGLCVQTGNMARMYADLLKLQALYLRGSIESGILVVATRDCANSFGGNVVTFERLTMELEHIFSQVITMPLVIIGFDNEI